MTPRSAVTILSAVGVAVCLGLQYRALGRAERRAEDAEGRHARAMVGQSATMAAQVTEETALVSAIEVLRKKVADLEAAGREREKELLAVRAELERARRSAEEAARRPMAEPPKPEAPKPAIEEAPAPKAPPEKPPAPSLGPTAVSDPNQVKKLTDGLNTLLAGVEGPEKWKVVSAKAAEDDRLVQVVLEARAADGTVAKSFQAGEARIVLQAAAGTLSIKLKEGSVTYPGNRTVPFPEGAYTVLLVVDSGPFRAAGNPLVLIQ